MCRADADAVADIVTLGSTPVPPKIYPRESTSEVMDDASGGLTESPGVGRPVLARVLSLASGRCEDWCSG